MAVILSSISHCSASRDSFLIGISTLDIELVVNIVSNVVVNHSIVVDLVDDVVVVDWGFVMVETAVLFDDWVCLNVDWVRDHGSLSLGSRSHGSLLLSSGLLGVNVSDGGVLNRGMLIGVRLLGCRLRNCFSRGLAH